MPSFSSDVGREYFAIFDSAISVPLKSTKTFKAKTTKPNPAKRGNRTRMAGALAASMVANGVQAADGVVVSRTLQVRGERLVIENGVAGDLLASGYVTLRAAANPVDEAFVLTAAGAAYLKTAIGTERWAAAAAFLNE